MTDQRRGKLKVFMGYAAGVGKTYKMLEEAHVLKAQGVDIVVGYFEPHGRQETIAKAKGLDAIPRKKLGYRGARSRKWIPKAFWHGIHRSVLSTSSPTQMFLDQRETSDGKTWPCS